MEKQYVHQIQKPIKKLNYYTPIYSNDINDVWQIDLMDIKNVASKNKNYKWLFVTVDVFSRFGYVVPMKDKTTANVIIAFKKVLQSAKPNKIMADNGTEFTSKAFTTICKDNNISIDYVDMNNHLIPHTGNRLGVVDRYIQTVRQRIQNYCDEHDTNKFIDIIQEIVYNINSSLNSGINAIPNQISNLDKINIEQRMNNKFVDANTHRKFFDINDNVRCVINKNLFEKGSTPKWSSKIHTIKEAQLNSYTLDNGQKYKYYQLQKVNISNEEKHKREQQIKEIKKQNLIKRRLNKESVDVQNILKRKRKRKPTNRFRF